ncbi:MAG: hypothetical protein LUD47_07565 [Clostridia bacterium]|nr:hypothetical protein [Clostridia bacterium]
MPRIAKVPSKLGDLQFECVVSRSVEYSATVPQYPVESGSYTADTILREPLELSLEVFVSEMIVSHRTEISGLDRVIDFKDKLLDMFYSGELYTLTTPDSIYENMAITSLSFPEQDYSNAMQISISLKQVTLTTPITVCAATYDYSGETQYPTGTTSTETGELDVGYLYDK